jgi:hypothetical protein
MMGRAKAAAVHLTEAALASDSLDQRMRLTRPGQVTWAQPALGRKCTDCQHYCFSGDDPAAGGICALVRTISRRHGPFFQGAEAWACSMFQELS